MEKASRYSRALNIMPSALVGLVMMAYLRWARPYQLRWGATQEEEQRPMPGDELNPNPKFLATRAITIEGKPEDIWPWLMQMGYRRAGFYGYDILENLGSPRGIRVRIVSARAPALLGRRRSPDQPCCQHGVLCD